MLKVNAELKPVAGKVADNKVGSTSLNVGVDMENFGGNNYGTLYAFVNKGYEVIPINEPPDAPSPMNRDRFS